MNNLKVMKLFKNKFFIIALSITLFVTILTATLSIMGQTGPLKNALNVISTPFRYVGIKIRESFDGFSRYFTAIEDMDKENEELRAKVSELERSLADKEAILIENKRLREYLDFKKTYPHLEITEAVILSTSSENYMTVFTLNKGTGDGIALGMPVIVEDGVVGSVCEIGYNWCRVRALTEASAAAGAYIPRSGAVGVVDGDISLKDTGCCILGYLLPDADVLVGDLVYTTGEGSVYPKDLLIGRVVSVETDGYLRTKTAYVECAVDFNSLRYVMIITDFEIRAEDAE